MGKKQNYTKKKEEEMIDELESIEIQNVFSVIIAKNSERLWKSWGWKWRIEKVKNSSFYT